VCLFRHGQQLEVAFSTRHEGRPQFALAFAHLNRFLQCKQPFTATREDARYCSCRCRVAAHRGTPPGTVWARVPVDIAKELARRPVNAQTGHIAEYSTKEAISPADKQDRSAELSTSRTQPDKSARPSPVRPNGGAFDGLRPGMPPNPRACSPPLCHTSMRA
jgi:hypothetical protein